MSAMVWSLLAAFLAAPAAAGPVEIFLESYGSLGGQHVFKLMVGDTTRQSLLAHERGRFNPTPFDPNAAHYYPNGDGSWRVWNWRLPGSEQEREAFRVFLSKPEVKDILERGEHSVRDFGEPGDFIYQRARIAAGALPEPLAALSPGILARFGLIRQYNADSTIEIYPLRPHDLGEEAERLYLEMIESLSSRLGYRAAGLDRCAFRRISMGGQCLYACGRHGSVAFDPQAPGFSCPSSFQWPGSVSEMPDAGK